MHPFKRAIARSTVRVFNAAGLEVKRRAKSPATTLLGLRNRPFQTIVDVGANEGQFAAIARGHFPNARILCFEPQPGPRATLETWAATAGPIEVFGVALGPEAGEVEFHVHEDHNSSSSLLPSSDALAAQQPETRRQRLVKVPVETLDAVMDSLAPPAAGELLLKLDVQGYEEEVIKGGENTFRRANACILEVCLDDFYEGQATFADLHDRLHSFGLRYAGNLDQMLAEDGHVMFLDAVFVR